MTAAEGESLRFIALGVVDDMLGIEALVRRVDVVVILLFSLKESKCFGYAESLSVMLWLLYCTCKARGFCLSENLEARCLEKPGRHGGKK